MRLVFCGAAREVTGSNILLEASGRKILLDCGLFQGSRQNEERNWMKFPFDPRSIDFVVVGHAHLDHTGRLPKLYREGFRGKIFATAPTQELAQLVLLDNEKLMSEEHRREKTPLLYGPGDIDGVVGLFVTLGYDQSEEIAPGIKLTLKNAGHILGSALTVIESEGKTLVYTSDLGNNPSNLLEAPDIIDHADYVICESTYGGRTHEDISRRQEKLNDIINKTIAENGVLMIPTFAIERTQELLHDIEDFCRGQNCVLPRFYLDSPLAEKVTAVFEKYPDFLKKNLLIKHKDVFGLKRIKMAKSVEDSKKIDEEPEPKIIIAGSGMLNGGRMLFHLQKYIEDSKNTLLIVGYQAAGTLGRRLLDGDKQVKILGKNYTVRATVLAIGSYSAHADNPQIINWMSKMSGIKKVFLVHGENIQAMVLARDLGSKFGFEVSMPQLSEEFVV